MHNYDVKKQVLFKDEIIGEPFAAYGDVQIFVTKVVDVSLNELFVQWKSPNPSQSVISADGWQSILNYDHMPFVTDMGIASSRSSTRGEAILYFPAVIGIQYRIKIDGGNPGYEATMILAPTTMRRRN